MPCVISVGMGQEAWRDELRALTDAVDGVKRDKAREVSDGYRPRTSQYSAETGRLIPPPSRAMSRGASRQQSRAGFLNKLNSLTDDINLEETVRTFTSPELGILRVSSAFWATRISQNAKMTRKIPNPKLFHRS